MILVISTMYETESQLIAGRLSRERTFANFESLWLFAKAFSAKFGRVASFGGNSKQSAKVFPRKSYLQPFRESFPLY